jgi:hypothetical protein
MVLGLEMHGYHRGAGGVSFMSRNQIRAAAYCSVRAR